ncbi:MAG: hypothetical protein AAF694_25875 [Bacteroidota bacterium]
MWIHVKGIQDLFLRIAKIGLDESIPEEEARSIMIHNYLGKEVAFSLP